MDVSGVIRRISGFFQICDCDYTTTKGYVTHRGTFY